MKSPAFFCLSLFLLFAFLFARTAREKSPTWDEVPYFGLGAHLLKTGRWDVAASCSHPPLAYYIHAIPCLFFPLDQTNWHPPAGRQQDVVYLRSADPGRGNRLLLASAYDGEGLFWLCRLMGLSFAALLAFALYRWGTDLYTPVGVVLVFLLFALSPNLLAHGPLINTDFAFAATFFCSVYAFRRLLLVPSHYRVLTAGAALGLALMSKLSALVLLAALPFERPLVCPFFPAPTNGRPSPPICLSACRRFWHWPRSSP